MKKAHFLSLIIGLALVALLFVGTSMGVRGNSRTNNHGTLEEERPGSFSLHIGSPKSSLRGFFESLKASLNVFGLVPKTEDEAALKELLEETKKQMAAEAQKQAEEQKQAKRKKRLRSQYSEYSDTDAYEAQGTPGEKSKIESTNAFLGGGSTGGAVATGPKYDSFMDENLPKDAQGWIARIVSQRSYRVFTQFVALYKVGNISPDVFYSVVRELLSDPDMLLVKYGVLALTGAIETESFATLVEFRSQLPGDPELFQLVQQGFDSYAQPANLSHLFTFLRNPENSEVFFEAVRIAENSIKEWYLREFSGEMENDAAETSLLVYGQLHRALKDGQRKATSEDTRSPIEGLLALMGGGQEDVVAGIDVPY